ncbi:lytic transglycosylase [Thermohalobacter berrensis]|uniref:Lytic transglycosylase n=1 Tax=Thermohalobacter berrensis TaxID=99594 RepID=A0A419T705_9FIRM|nr:lytic transglycosylase [Thermohalobacter berrensis]
MSFRYKRVLLFLLIALIILLAIYNIKWIFKFLYPLNYEEYIGKYSKEYGIDPFLVAAIIRVESKYYKEAKSYKGAKGLMQISPITGKWAAKELGIKNYNEDILYNPEINIKIGCWYLSKLMDQFDNNISVVVAAYNGGSGNVTKWLSNKKYSSDGINLDYIPFKETEQYVDKVLNSYKIYKKLYDYKHFYPEE